MRHFTLVTTAVLSLLFGTNRSEAGPSKTIFDNSQGLSSFITSTSGTGNSTVIFAQNDTRIGGFAIPVQFFNTAEARLFITDDTTHAVLYESPLIKILAGPGLAYVSTPAMNFTLKAGQQYDFGLVPTIIDGSNYHYGYTSEPYSQSNITSLLTGLNLYTPELQWRGAGVPLDPDVRLFAPAVSPVPEPATLSLVDAGLLGCVVVGRRRFAG